MAGPMTTIRGLLGAPKRIFRLLGASDDTNVPSMFELSNVHYCKTISCYFV